MPYRSYEYQPQPWQPDDRHLSDLMYRQNQIQANRIQQQGANSAAMWRGMGNAASGMLSDLSKYKAEEPMRREAERVRKEQDKLRGLEQMAGAGGMDQEAYGKLLQQEGFRDRGQKVLDEDMSRKATKATYDEAAAKRQERVLSEVTQQMYDIERSPDPVTAYRQYRDGMRAKLGDKAQLPDEYDPNALATVRGGIETYQDKVRRNEGARLDAAFLSDQKKPLEEKIAKGQAMMGKLLPIAKDAASWNAAWTNFENSIEDYDQATKDKIREAIPFSREFSAQAYQYAKDYALGPQRDDDKDPSNQWGAAMDIFERRNGRKPTSKADEQEFNQILRGFTASTHVATGGGRDPDRTAQYNLARRAFDQQRNWIFEHLGPGTPEAVAAERKAWKSFLFQTGQKPDTPMEDEGGGGFEYGGWVFDTQEQVDEARRLHPGLDKPQGGQQGGGQQPPPQQEQQQQVQQQQQPVLPPPQGQGMRGSAPPVPFQPPSIQMQMPQQMPSQGRLIQFTNGRETMRRYEGEAGKLAKHGWYPVGGQQPPSSLADLMKTRSRR